MSILLKASIIKKPLTSSKPSHESHAIVKFCFGNQQEIIETAENIGSYIQDKKTTIGRMNLPDGSTVTLTFYMINRDKKLGQYSDLDARISFLKTRDDSIDNFVVEPLEDIEIVQAAAAEANGPDITVTDVQETVSEPAEAAEAAQVTKQDLSTLLDQLESTMKAITNKPAQSATEIDNIDTLKSIIDALDEDIATLNYLSQALLQSFLNRSAPIKFADLSARAEAISSQINDVKADMQQRSDAAKNRMVELSLADLTASIETLSQALPQQTEAIGVNDLEQATTLLEELRVLMNSISDKQRLLSEMNRDAAERFTDRINEQDRAITSFGDSITRARDQARRDAEAGSHAPAINVDDAVAVLIGEIDTLLGNNTAAETIQTRLNELLEVLDNAELPVDHLHRQAYNQRVANLAGMGPRGTAEPIVPPGADNDGNTAAPRRSLDQAIEETIEHYHAKLKSLSFGSDTWRGLDLSGYFDKWQTLLAVWNQLQANHATVLDSDQKLTVTRDLFDEQVNLTDGRSLSLREAFSQRRMFKSRPTAARAELDLEEEFPELKNSPIA